MSFAASATRPLKVAVPPATRAVAESTDRAFAIDARLGGERHSLDRPPRHVAAAQREPGRGRGEGPFDATRDRKPAPQKRRGRGRKLPEVGLRADVEIEPARAGQVAEPAPQLEHPLSSLQPQGLHGKVPPIEREGRGHELEPSFPPRRHPLDGGGRGERPPHPASVVAEPERQAARANAGRSRPILDEDLRLAHVEGPEAGPSPQRGDTEVEPGLARLQERLSSGSAEDESVRTELEPQQVVVEAVRSSLEARCRLDPAQSESQRLPAHERQMESGDEHTQAQQESEQEPAGFASHDSEWHPLPGEGPPLSCGQKEKEANEEPEPLLSSPIAAGYDRPARSSVPPSPFFRGLFLALSLNGVALSARAQPYEIRWLTVDGGGTTRAAGGTYELGGTAGQPDAGRALASPYGIASGFWATTLTSTGAELHIAVNDSPDPVALGGSLSYTITVTNDGPADATGVVVDNPTPSGLVFAFNSGDCVTDFPCILGLVAAGQSRLITASFQVPVGYAGPNPITDTATVAAATPDPNSADNAATVQTAVGAASADLVLTKHGPATTFRGADVVYSITVSNEGPSDAPAVQVVDTPPPGLVFVSNTGDCTTGFPCSLGAIRAGQARVILATFRVPLDYGGPDPIVNAASATSSVPDPVPLDNSDDTQAVLTAPPGVDFHTVTPCRLIDTRLPSGAPALGAQATRRLTIASACGIPPTAQAVSVNVAITAPTAGGNLRLFPAGAPLPLVSSINYSAGQTRTNNAIVSLGPDGDLDVFCAQASGTVQLILDVNGYFQ